MRRGPGPFEAWHEKARAERLRVTVQGTAFVTQYNYPAVGGRAPATLRTLAHVLKRKSPFHSAFLMITILVVLEREGSRSESIRASLFFYRFLEVEILDREVVLPYF